MAENIIRIALFRGRHNIETDISDYIYIDAIDDPMNFGVMERTASDRIFEIMGKHEMPVELITVSMRGSMDTVMRYAYDCCVELYVTGGLTAALIAAINALADIRVRGITLMHYDSSDGSYQPQVVMW